jgi:inhibitor of cysteine peptidase
MLELDESADGHELVLQTDQRFAIRLGENPTTGYSWSLVAGGEPTCVLIDHTFAPAAGPPGQGGSHRWQFRTAQTGRGAIELVLSRPWASGAAPLRRFALVVRVPG